MDLKTTIQRWTLFLGVLQVTVGCGVGFIPPTAVQWFRGIVMAHIEFTANGVLMVALGFLVMKMELGASGMKAWFAAVQLGTWTNGGAGLVAAFIGYSSKLMPTLNAAFPPPNGPDHPAVTGLLLLCGVTIMIALILTLAGLLRQKPTSVSVTS
ncbi:MAG TPA: hypothetical protein VGR73_10940 [Bryobacteraceae bacterium]|nr:hypothetical protein [Bryobacteraceae bacterium]